MSQENQADLNNSLYEHMFEYEDVTENRNLRQQSLKEQAELDALLHINMIQHEMEMEYERHLDIMRQVLQNEKDCLEEHFERHHHYALYQKCLDEAAEEEEIIKLLQEQAQQRSDEEIGHQEQNCKLVKNDHLI